VAHRVRGLSRPGTGTGLSEAAGSWLRVWLLLVAPLLLLAAPLLLALLAYLLLLALLLLLLLLLHQLRQAKKGEQLWKPHPRRAEGRDPELTEFLEWLLVQLLVLENAEYLCVSVCC